MKTWEGVFECRGFGINLLFNFLDHICVPFVRISCMNTTPLPAISRAEHGLCNGQGDGGPWRHDQLPQRPGCDCASSECIVGAAALIFAVISHTSQMAAANGSTAILRLLYEEGIMSSRVVCLHVISC